MPNVPNYAREMDAVLRRLDGRRPRLLLHACCGPCSSAVLEQLCQHFEITILYYNPNIWPDAEYHRREQELERFVAQAHPLGVTVVEDRYDPREFYEAARGLEDEPERGRRCTACYRLRMRRAAQYAASTASTGSPPPCPSAPTRTPPGSTKSGRSWPPNTGCPTCLRLQKEERLPALLAAVGRIRTVSPGLLRLHLTLR